MVLPLHAGIGVRSLAALFLALLVFAPSASAAETLRIVDPITDNYKASYNADPSVPERRTWLAVQSLSAGGTTWRPADPAQILFDPDTVALNGADGRTGVLSVQLISGSLASRQVRIDPTSAASGGRWGPLVEIQDRSSLRAASIILELTITIDGQVLATGRVSYRYDAALANVEAGHIEYNGPAGRWFVGATPTRTEWAPVPATVPVVLAAMPPRITSVVVPARTTQRTIAMRVTGRAGSARITHLRVSVAGRAFGRWVRTAPRYSVILPAGVATRLLRVQLRDANGLTSTVVARRVRCSC